MTPLETLTRELGPEVAAAALSALQAEAERQREGRPAVRLYIVFHPDGAPEQPEWGRTIDPDTPCRYNDIHNPST